jgi:hypothetical protein
VDDVRVEVPPEEIEAFATATGYEEVWPRSGGALAVRRTGWMRLYDVLTEAGPRMMFVPNGAGTVEWHLGWEMEFPESHYVMVLPLDDAPQGLEIPMGILDYRTVQRLNAETGFAIAIRPRQSVALRRGEPIAQLLLLHPDSIRAKADEPADEA